MDKLKKILEEFHPEIDYNTCNTLIDDEFFDSLDVVNLIAEISDQFGVEIPPKEVVPQNFNSAQALYDLIQRLA